MTDTPVVVQVLVLLVVVALAGVLWAGAMEWKSPVEVARRARKARVDALVAEYVGYGFDRYNAEWMAERKIDAEAVAAYESVNDTLGVK